jgi:hypothetical protein
MGTGDNSTTWGNVTNVNLGTALEEAIAGSADVAFSNASVTLTLTDTNATQTARNMRLNLTGTATSGYNLVVPAIEKAYIVNNATDGTITVKNATGANVAVPAGKTTWVYNTGSNVVDAVTHVTSLTLGTFLPIASGGTGGNTAANARTALSAAVLGANSDITSLSGLTTALSIAQGGTGSNTAALARTALGATTVGGNVFTLTNPSAITFPRFNADNTVSALDAATFRTAIGAGTSSTTGTVTSVAMSVPAFLSIAGSPITASGTLAVTLSGTALPIANGGTGSTSTTYCSLTSNITGTLPIANGGTGSTSTTYCSLTTNVTGTLPVANGGSGATTLTGILKGTGATAFTAATAGTDYVAPGGALGTPSSGTLTNCTFPTLNQNTTGSSGSCTGNAATATSAGSVTSSVTFNSSGGAAAGTTFNGSAARTIDYSTVGAYAATNPSGFTSNTGTVTSVATSGSTNGLSLTGGTITSTGTVTLSGSVTSVASGATIDSITIGYRSIPRSTTATTAAVGDVGKCIAVTAGIAIPNSTFAAGDAVSIYNDSASAITITATITTLRLAGTTTTGNRTLAARGMATVWFNSATEAIISGAGVS